MFHQALLPRNSRGIGDTKVSGAQTYKLNCWTLSDGTVARAIGSYSRCKKGERRGKKMPEKKNKHQQQSCLNDRLTIHIFLLCVNFFF